MKIRRRPRPFDMEPLVSAILRIGLLTSLALVAAGLTWRWIATGTVRFDYMLPKTNVWQFVMEEVRLAQAGALRPRLLINVGLAVLMLTPYVRVLASMVYFAAVERNGKYALFTGFVLATLSYSLLLR